MYCGVPPGQHVRWATEVLVLGVQVGSAIALAAQERRDVASPFALTYPCYYITRHLAWLEFNRRVLQEALDARNPLLERVKFLAITASNLDEFVEVRVAGLLQQVEHGSQEAGPDGLSPQA